MTDTQVRPSTLAERLEGIAEVFELRAHVIAERYDEIDGWELKMELAQSRAATVREAIAALAHVPATAHDEGGSAQ